MNELEFQAALETIPGESGWWSEATRAEYIGAAGDLVDQGVPESTVVEVLGTLYRCAAEEFGG